MNETFDEQTARLRAMAEDERGETWDLSENDRAAIVAALAKIQQLHLALASARGAGAAREE